MQSLSEVLGGRKGGYWTSGPGMRRRARRSAGGGGLRALLRALAQAWAGSPRGFRTWAIRQRGPWRLAGLFLAGTIVYGLSVGGHLAQMQAHLTAEASALVARAGFTVQQLTVVGLHRAERDEVVQALGLGPGHSMLSVDTSAVQERLERLPWVRHAQIMRLLPSTLHVVVEERTPFAVWQLQGRFALVDADGVVLGPLGGEDASGLPLIVGEGAAAAAPDLFRALAGHPGLRAEMHAAVRVADRRWNLRLVDGIEVRLPEDNVQRALDRFAEFDYPRALSDGDLVAIDVRLPDRITLRLTETAAARLSEQISQPRRARIPAARET